MIWHITAAPCIITAELTSKHNNRMLPHHISLVSDRVHNCWCSQLKPLIWSHTLDKHWCCGLKSDKHFFSLWSIQLQISNADTSSFLTLHVFHTLVLCLHLQFTSQYVWFVMMYWWWFEVNVIILSSPYLSHPFIQLCHELGRARYILSSGI